MAFCANCGTEMQDGVKFCPSCGQAAEAAPPPPPQQGYQQPPPQYPPQQGYQQPPTQYPPQQGYQQPGYQQPMTDAQANKGMAVLSYLWLLLLIPLCTGKYKVSQFVKFHLNQGIVFGVIYTGYMIVDRILNVVVRVPRITYVWGIPVETVGTPGWLTAILGLLYIPFAVLCIIGIVNAVKGQEKPLPIIGNLFTALP